MFEGIHEMAHLTEKCRTVRLDGDGQLKTGLERVRKHLRETQASGLLQTSADHPGKRRSLLRQ